MTDKKISDTPDIELQQSSYTIKEIQRKTSAVLLHYKEYGNHSNNQEADIILCLANEIAQLRKEINALKLLDYK